MGLISFEEVEKVQDAGNEGCYARRGVCTRWVRVYEMSCARAGDDDPERELDSRLRESANGLRIYI